MNAKLHWTLAALLGALAFAAAPMAAPAAEAPDFPPGLFSDGGRYKLSDFEGKVLVLFFYESECPRCRGEIPNRNKVVEQFRGKPVKFIAVGPGDTLTDVTGYTKSTHLQMPAFSDSLGVMQARYKTQISLQNIWQFRIIGPNGDVVGMQFEPEEIEKALQGVKWKYKDGGYDPKLNNVIELLEWNQYAPALSQLRPLTKAGNKTVAESANKLLEAVKAEGKQWLDEAQKARSEDPVKAFDLYSKVSNAFGGDELGKAADAELKSLKSDKAVTAELAARKMYDALAPVMSKATAKQKAEVAAYCQSIAKKYPESPTGKKAAALAAEIQEAPAPS